MLSRMRSTENINYHFAPLAMPSSSVFSLHRRYFIYCFPGIRMPPEGHHRSRRHIDRQNTMSAIIIYQYHFWTEFCSPENKGQSSRSAHGRSWCAATDLRRRHRHPRHRCDCHVTANRTPPTPTVFVAGISACEHLKLSGRHCSEPILAEPIQSSAPSPP